MSSAQAVVEPNDYLAALNEAQREAVLHTEGPLLVIAGAGSGKTRVLTHRVAHLIRACGVKPNEILAITFTNKAAGEMRERLEHMLGRTARAIWILTFHAACGRILRAEASRLGYRSTFTIYDQADQVRVVKACLEELGRDPKRFTPRGIHAQISNAKNRLVGPDEYMSRVASFYDQTVAEVYELYQRRLFGSNAVDFDDMLMLTVDVLERFPEAREHWQQAFRYILVDEYQDTNHAQYRLLQLLADRAPERLRGWRSRSVGVRASRGGYLQHPRLRARLPRRRTIALEQNYRSTNSILGAANAVIENNRERKPKRLFSELGDGRSGAGGRGRGRARGGPVRRRRDRAAGGDRALGERDRGLLPDERTVTRARGRARPPGRALPGDRRSALLRARGDQGRDRLPRRPHQLGRRRLAAPHRQPAPPRDRRHLASAARHPRRRARASRSGRRWPTRTRRGSAPPR